MSKPEYIEEKYGDVETYNKACRIQAEMKAYKRKPSKGDIAGTRRLLAQFGYFDVVIPALPSFCALERWRREYIIRRMGEEDTNA